MLLVLPHMKEPANPFLRDFQRKRPRMNGLAGSLPFIRSNLCTRHILNKITPCGHEDWPDKRRRGDYTMAHPTAPDDHSPFWRRGATYRVRRGCLDHVLAM